MGCSAAAAFTVAYPRAALSLSLYWPVGGAKYRLRSHQRFAEHSAFVTRHGLGEVIALVTKDGKPFSADPRGGPWATAYARHNVDAYKLIVAGMARTLFGRDTAPGAEPEDLLAPDIPALVIPGCDASHATSAARYLEECLPGAEYWDVHVAAQTEASVAPRLLGFLNRVSETSR